MQLVPGRQQPAIVETEARLVVAFDVAKFQSFTNEAIQAGLGAD